MQTITHNSSTISAYLYADDDIITATAENTTIPYATEFDDAMLISDLNTSNSTIHTGVTPPLDWVGGKYFFDGTTWADNPDYVEFIDHIRLADEASGG
jgi:hypothetical protein